MNLNGFGAYLRAEVILFVHTVIANRFTEQSNIITEL